MQPTAETIALAWLEKWTHDREDRPLYEPDLDFELPRASPRVCLDAIVFLLSQIPADPSNRQFQVLAAGPLEDLLRNHGAAFLDEIELLVRRDPAFRLLLNGAWLKGAPSEVVARLAKYRGAPW